MSASSPARTCCPTCGDWSTTSMLRSRSCLNARSRRAADRGKLTRTRYLRKERSRENTATQRACSASTLGAMAEHDRAAARREITDALSAALDRRHEVLDAIVDADDRAAAVEAVA